jgi:hypothetical protein
MVHPTGVENKLYVSLRFQRAESRNMEIKNKARQIQVKVKRGAIASIQIYFRAGK